VALVFGKYERIRRIAQGGMGEVFLARQTGVLDRLAILKALRADLSKEHEFVEQFLDEARVAATLNHPNIVAIFDVGDWQGTYYIAMEYIAGEDLSKLWYAAAKAGIGLPFQVSVRIIMEAALGLDHAHRAKDVRGKPLTIVHRDISPQNIMVRQDGVTKLVDFGIAKAANKNSRTQAGMVKGKLQYMSPEQVRGEPLDGRSDQFSLGIVLWEMCTGRRLFKADSEINTLQKILQTPVPKPTSHVPGFPAELEAIIMRMLERDINRRFASLGDVAARLKEYLDRSSVQSGEVGVAAFVQQILGKELDDRIADLTPMEPTEASASTPMAPARQAARATSTPAPTAKPSQSFYDDDKDAPTAIVSPEDRPDRGAPGSASEDGQNALNGLPLGPTGEWVVRRTDGGVVHFQEWATLQQWVLDGKLAFADLVSSDGRRFSALGDDPQLAQFFSTGDAARASAIPVPVPGIEPTQQRHLALDTHPMSEPVGAAADGQTLPTAQPPAPKTPARPHPVATPTPLDQAPPAPPAPPDAVDPFDAGPTGQFSLGDLPSMQTGAWQLGTEFAVLAAAAAAQNRPAADVPPPVGTDTTVGAGPLSPPSGQRRRLPPALIGALGIMGSLVFVGLVLRMAAPATLQTLVGGTNATELAQTRAALTALHADEPATTNALRASLQPLVGDDATIDALVADALLAVDQVRVAETAAALAVRADPARATEAKASVDAVRAAIGPLAARLVQPAASDTPWTRYARAAAAVASTEGGSRDGLVVPSDPATDPALTAEAAMTGLLFRAARTLTTASPADLQALAAADLGSVDDRRIDGLRAVLGAVLATDEQSRASARRTIVTRQQRAPSDPRLAAALTLLDVTPPPTTTTTTTTTTTKPPEPKPPEAKPPEAKPAEPVETFESALSKGQKSQRAGRSKEALKMLTIALGLRPGDTKAILALAWTQLDLKRYEAAAASFRTVLSNDAGVAEAQFGLGEALRALGRTTDAVFAFEKYLQMAPSGPDAEIARNAIQALQ
jgi:serine/threonine-protein kinase